MAKSGLLCLIYCDSTLPVLLFLLDNFHQLLWVVSSLELFPCSTPSIASRKIFETFLFVFNLLIHSQVPIQSLSVLSSESASVPFLNGDNHLIDLELALHVNFNFLEFGSENRSFIRTNLRCSENKTIENCS